MYEESVNNLHGPILSPTAIADTTPAHRMAGDSIRAKVCQFVCARLLSTYHFLSNRLNTNDACLLLTRCFEQMTYLTINQKNSWIKSKYTRRRDVIQAERHYENQVFYCVYNRLTEYKTYINQLSLQSDIQTNLQKYIDQMPIIIQFTDFETELHRSIDSSEVSIKILQNILNSFPFLKLTKYIYDLSQFYLLLHVTYTQSIKRNEFVGFTLQQLYDRNEKQDNHFYEENEIKSHRTIIDNGITAVNSYHDFANGLIRPGACDETQRFERISFDTPIHYLVTNENHDEGDIVMRILR